MAVGWTKKHVAAMADTLDTDHPDLESAARAALDTAMELLEERAKFAVVGQVVATQEHGTIPPDHHEAVKMCLGLFDTDTKANDAAAQLTYSTASGDQLKTWVVPMFYGTPSAWHGERRTHYADLAKKANDKRRAKFQASIEKRRAEQQDIAAMLQARERAAGGQVWPCTSIIRKAGECRHDPKCK